MLCYYHPKAKAVGLCKNCQKGLCQECAVDVGNGLACKDRCETQVKDINDVFQRIRNQYSRLGSTYLRTVWISSIFGISFFFFFLLLIYAYLRTWLASLPMLLIGLFAIGGAINSYRESKRHKNSLQLSHMLKSYDVLIIGGGVMGCVTAFGGLKPCLSLWKFAQADWLVSPKGFHVLSKRLQPCESCRADSYEGTR